MKKIFLLTCFTIASLWGFSQSQYSTLSNHVYLSGVVNQDTFLIENIRNLVEINGELGKIRVEYHNLDSRRVSGTPRDSADQRTDLTIVWWNEYDFLDESIKADQTPVTITDEINISLNDHEMVVPVTITFNRVRGGGIGFTSRIDITGTFSAKSLEGEEKKFIFKEDVTFTIQLMVQSLN